MAIKARDKLAKKRSIKGYAKQAETYPKSCVQQLILLLIKFKIEHFRKHHFVSDSLVLI